jgi:hypothetical protein
MNTSTMSPPPTTADRDTPWRVALAWVAVALTPFEFAVGFVMGYALGLDPTIENPVVGWDAVWRVVILWLIVVALSLIGLALSWSARRHGETSALGALIVNGMLFAGLTFDHPRARPDRRLQLNVP